MGLSVCKEKQPVQHFVLWTRRDDTNTHYRLSNRVSQAGEVLTRFYRGVDALPSI